MAIRVKKLAKELNQSPTEVLGVLHAIGFTRFRSVNDMLSDQIVTRLKKAIRNSVAPMPLKSIPQATAEKQEHRPKSSQVYTESDLDLDLHAFVGDVQPNVSPSPPPRPRTTPEPVDNALFEMTDRVRVLEEENTRLELMFKRAIVELDEMKARQRQEQELSISYVPMSLLLKQRGLESDREMSAAIQAIAKLKPTEQWLSRLHVADADSFSEWIGEKLRLVSSESPLMAAEGFAPVVVAIDRAEQMGDAAIQQAVQELSELFLLFGLRRVLLVGDVETYAKPLRQHMDSRIQLQIETERTRNAAEAERDVRRQDAIVLWNVDTSDGAREIYDSSKAEVLHFDGDNLLRLRKDFHVSLDG